MDNLDEYRTAVVVWTPGSRTSERQMLKKPGDNMWVQEPHTTLLWIEGCVTPCAGPCPTLWATWDLISSAATTISAGILLLFLSLSQILACLLQARKRRQKLRHV